MASGLQFHQGRKTEIFLNLQTDLIPVLMVVVLFLDVKSLNCLFVLRLLPPVESLQTSNLVD